ncbi:hypothetical protein [Enterobacter ludwigii]|uniref:hypothetical protein n=1 Tax=Enterobacter ludwigii TaxID=299767 RepID=UPI002FD0D274
MHYFHYFLPRSARVLRGTDVTHATAGKYSPSVTGHRLIKVYCRPQIKFGPAHRRGEPLRTGAEISLSHLPTRKSLPGCVHQPVGDCAASFMRGGVVLFLLTFALPADLCFSLFSCFFIFSFFCFCYFLFSRFVLALFPVLLFCFWLLIFWLFFFFFCFFCFLFFAFFFRLFFYCLCLFLFLMCTFTAYVCLWCLLHFCGALHRPLSPVI